MLCEDYVAASTIEEALATLASLRGEARIIAGGTDLAIQLQRRERTGIKCLVDITRIPGLDEVRVKGPQITVGAATTFTHLSSSPQIQHLAAALAEAAAWVGSPQIRNVGTLAGNVVNAQPAADGSIALLAMDAEAQIANLTGRQWVPVSSLYLSPGVSRVDPTSEMITALRFRAHGPREGSAFERMARRRALSLPLINVAAYVLLDADCTRMREVRIALGPVAPVPFRALQAEAVLKGQLIADDVLTEAIETVVRESKPRSSLLRAGKEYRQELIRTLTRQAILRAITRAKGR